MSGSPSRSIYSRRSMTAGSSLRRSCATKSRGGSWARRAERGSITGAPEARTPLPAPWLSSPLPSPARSGACADLGTRRLRRDGGVVILPVVSGLVIAISDGRGPGRGRHRDPEVVEQIPVARARNPALAHSTEVDDRRGRGL